MPAEAMPKSRVRLGNICLINAHAGRVSEERADVRREVIAELVGLAGGARCRHDDLRRQDEEHGREECNQNALDGGSATAVDGSQGITGR